ncbi:hypothetical protein CYMTET_35050 [Cymbomonas tetramitiformis]|uniref:Protein kinase domain-containing protein n=1 Tax=Cymbomonas tetramitiformis TaxID=36881 RepID=A0AAE0FA11_9CHLO|nr:hypothetical protein CYMTET_35050 [Cymbomonas tetramitiformis]|eukprot:gene11734-13857_t
MATSALSQRQYPTEASGYDLKEEVGRGASAKVWRAICLPFNEVVAVKILDLERQEPANMEEIRRETQTMTLLSHPNLVKSYCSFVTEQSLWVIMPYLAGGSCLNLLKWAHPKGFDEVLIATILKAVLQALDYCHRNGLIHRDIKAGNILLDASGIIKIADFGVSASNWGSQDKRHQTFVGTPCWMAPEVMEMKQGYDFHADIWSLGITVLELAHGHAPFAKYPPMKVLMMTIQQPAPTLEDTSGKHFSKALREFVSLCLDKDPEKRPSAAKLLEHKFLKEARKKEILVKHLLEGQPSLGERTRKLREREVERRAQMNGGLKESTDREEKSRSEYTRGISGWNFDVNAIKEEASRQPLPQVPENSMVGVSSTNSLSALGAEKSSGDSLSAPSALTSPQDAGAKKVTKTGEKGRFAVYEEEKDPEGGNTQPEVKSVETPKPVNPLEAPGPSAPPALERAPSRDGERVGRFTLKPDDEITEKPQRGRFSLVDDDQSKVKAEEKKMSRMGSAEDRKEEKVTPAGAAARKEDRPAMQRTDSQSEMKPSRFFVVDREPNVSKGVVATAQPKIATPSQTPKNAAQAPAKTQQQPAGPSPTPEQLVQTLPALLSDMQTMMAKSASLAAQQQEIQMMTQNAVKTLSVMQGDSPPEMLKIVNQPANAQPARQLKTEPVQAAEDLQKMVSTLVEENTQLKRRIKELERLLNATAAEKHPQAKIR